MLLRSTTGLMPYRHNSTNPYYLHYFASSAQSEIKNAETIGNRSSYGILQVAKTKISMAKAKQVALIRQMAANNQLNLHEAKDIEDLILDPSWLQNFNIESSVQIRLPSFQEVRENGPENYIADAQNATSLLGQNLNIIETQVMNSLKEDAKDIDIYLELLKDYFLTSKNMTTETGWQTEVLRSLLSKRDQAFFSKSDAAYKGKFKEWSADKTKLLAAMCLLKDPNFTQYIETVASGQGVEINRGKNHFYSKDVAEILGEFFQKMQKCVDQLQAIGAEGAVGVGVQDALEKTYKAFKKADDGIKQMSGSSWVTVETDLSGTEWAFQEVNLKGTGTAFERAQSRVSKGDTVALNITKGNVTVRQNISVKDYKTVSVTPNNPGVSISLQSGTPLLTILAREAGLGNQLFSIYQLLAAHQGFGFYQDSLVQTWNKIIDAAKYDALLTTLAGFTSSLDQVFYLVFNGKIYDIVTIIDNIQNGNGSIDWTQNSVPGIIQSDGFNYWTYNVKNQWLGDLMPNSTEAEERSDNARQAISQTMYDTKVAVKIHIAELASLASLN